MLACNAAFAGHIYSIDPTQSWVSAYVPSWTAFNYTPFPPVLAIGELPTTPTSTIIWNLDWVLTNFQWSGTFQGDTEVSPWEPNWAHLAISNGNLQTLLPGYVTAFNLPSFITYSVPTGNVFQINPCLTDDPFYSPNSGLCISSSFPPSLAGLFGGNALELTGGAGGIPLPVFTAIPPGLGTLQQITNPGTPPIDATQFPAATRWASYQLVANAVPEPGTLSLIFLGVVALYQINRRKLTS